MCSSDLHDPEYYKYYISKFRLVKRSILVSNFLSGYLPLMYTKYSEADLWLVLNLFVQKMSDSFHLIFCTGMMYHINLRLVSSSSMSLYHLYSYVTPLQWDTDAEKGVSTTIGIIRSRAPVGSPKWVKPANFGKWNNNWIFIES